MPPYRNSFTLGVGGGGDDDEVLFRGYADCLGLPLNFGVVCGSVTYRPGGGITLLASDSGPIRPATFLKLGGTEWLSRL